MALCGIFGRTWNTPRFVLWSDSRCAGHRNPDKVLTEEQVQGPIQGNADFLFQAGQLAQVNGSPETPGDEAGKIQPQDVGDAGSFTNRCQLTKHGKDEGFLGASANRGFKVARQHLALAQCVLGRGRV